MNPGVTILICTYNGAERLPVTLQYIAQQVIPASLSCEVILVDNASLDNTVQLAQEEWSKYDTRIVLRIIAEPRPGLTYARESGFAAAAYEFIILCDDDNWLCPSYVDRAFTIMMQHPSIGLLGGYGQFVYEAPPPEWLVVFNLYAGGPQAAASGEINDHLVYGAGTVLRKAAWETLRRHGFAGVLTDRLGHQLSSGGDYELSYAIALAGYVIWYDEQLIFQHFITANRLTRDYYITYIKESSRCFSVLEPYKILLKTGRHGLGNFRWELFKSFWYHVKKTGALLFKIALGRKGPGRRTAYMLELLLLKGRLRSYEHFVVMEKNYKQAIELKLRLLKENVPKPRSSDYAVVPD
jgi:glycosyltransferase involved in cell wall biosynthesis